MKPGVIILVLISLVLPGCGHSPVIYNVIPVTDGRNPHASRTIMHVEDHNAKTILNFDSQSGDYSCFFAVIQNKGDSSVTFYPNEIYAEAFRTEEGLDTTQPEYLDALDPDYQLKIIDIDIAELEKDKGVTDALNCCLVGVFIMDDFSSITEGKTEEDEAWDEEKWEILSEKISQDNVDYSNEKYELAMEKYYWRSEALNITELAKGEKTAGIFYIPVKKDAQWFRVVIPVGENEYVYNFRQSKHK